MSVNGWMKFLKGLSSLPEALSLNYVTKCSNLYLFLDYIINLITKFLLLGIGLLLVALDIANLASWVGLPLALFTFDRVSHAIFNLIFLCIASFMWWKKQMEWAFPPICSFWNFHGNHHHLWRKGDFIDSVLCNLIMYWDVLNSQGKKQLYLIYPFILSSVNHIHAQ